MVIPKELREAAGLHPGTEVDFTIDGVKVTIEVRDPRSLRSLGGTFKGSDLLTGLLEDRARERD